MVGLDGLASIPKPYSGYAEDGCSSALLSSGTFWKGIGESPEAALMNAKEGRASGLFAAVECAERLENALGANKWDRDTGEPLRGLTGELIDEARWLLGNAIVPSGLKRVDSRTVLAWVERLRNAAKTP